jgi:hypothetical protein
MHHPYVYALYTSFIYLKAYMVTTTMFSLEWTACDISVNNFQSREKKNKGCINISENHIAAASSSAAQFFYEA